jgi:hypothetical protein
MTKFKVVAADQVSRCTFKCETRTSCFLGPDRCHVPSFCLAKAMCPTLH